MFSCSLSLRPELKALNYAEGLCIYMRYMSPYAPQQRFSCKLTDPRKPMLLRFVCNIRARMHHITGLHATPLKFQVKVPTSIWRSSSRQAAAGSDRQRQAAAGSGRQRQGRQQQQQHPRPRANGSRCSVPGRTSASLWVASWTQAGRCPSSPNATGRFV